MHVAMFLVGRLINGFGVGLMNSVIPLFQSEISPATQRGKLVGFHGFILVAGYVCPTFLVVSLFMRRPYLESIDR